MRIGRKFLIAALVLVCGCKTAEKQQALELEGSLNRFIKAVESRKEEDLAMTVFIPNVKDYRNYVSELLLKYLDDLSKGKVQFDDQGIVLTRFLGLGQNRFQVLKAEKTNENEAKMRISIHFAYDNNIKHAGMPKGTQFYIPGKPWCKIYTIEIGSDNNPAPREQLKYIEIEVQFRKTNLEGHWQVREMKAIPESMQFEMSLFTLFE